MVSKHEEASPAHVTMCDALVLCGGLGTRLQPVLRDRPKGLAPISGRPFLDILIEELIRHGLRRILLCAGHGADQIVTHFAHRRDAEFVVCVEPKPLGTGGAVRYALPHVHTDPFIVANGDSFCRVNYGDLLRDHASWRPAATIVVTPPNERTDTGTVEVDAEGRITSFAEKLAQANQQRGYVNAGVYVLQRGLIESERPETPVSLERDIFPRAARDSRCRAFHVAGPVIDIGTPERYAAAQALSRW